MPGDSRAGLRAWRPCEAPSPRLSLRAPRLKTVRLIASWQVAACLTYARTLRMESDPLDEAPLVCAECGVTAAPGAKSWRALLDEDGDAVMFCPECAEREFGHDS